MKNDCYVDQQNVETTNMTKFIDFGGRCIYRIWEDIVIISGLSKCWLFPGILKVAVVSGMHDSSPSTSLLAIRI